MTVAILLLACLVLAAAVGVLGAALRELRRRVQALETLSARAPGLVTGASAPSSTSESASAPSSTSVPLVEEVAQQPSRDHRDVGASSEYVITRLGDEPEEQPAPTLETRLFADIVLRESVVKAASFVYGVRRGLSPANRNRIWFEMRREVKRARKERKAEEREAVREWRARQRAAVQEESAA
jgi:hypothetical protein